MVLEIDKLRYVNAVLLITVLFMAVSCNNSFETYVFSKAGRPSPEMLLNQGYEKSAVDVKMFEKTISDTTIYFEFNYSSELFAKSWRFVMPQDIELFFKNRDMYLMCPPAYSDIHINEIFCVKNHKENSTYFCEIDNGQLEVTYYIEKE